MEQRIVEEKVVVGPWFVVAVESIEAVDQWIAGEHTESEQGEIALGLKEC